MTITEDQIKALRPGDVVLVRAVYQEKCNGHFPRHIVSYRISSSDIVSVEPRPLAVGDRVKDAVGEEGEVVAIPRSFRKAFDEVALWNEKNGMYVERVSKLTRIP